MKALARLRERLDRDEGVVIVLAALLLVIIFVLAALAVDITMQSTDRQHLWNSADAAALAGASQLPNGGAASSEALDFALANDPDLSGNVTPTFRCLVGDRNNDGQPDAGEVPTTCDPGPDVPATGPPWVCADGVCVAPCDPAVGDTCNTIVLQTETTTDYAFAPVVGIDSGDTSIISAACRGTCGAGATGPVALVLVIDRSGSMTPGDLDTVEKASLAVLTLFDPVLHHVGLAVRPPAEKVNECVSAGSTADGRFLVVGLSDDYKDNPDLDVDGDSIPDIDSTSELVNIIRCSTDSGSTNLGSPIRDGANATSEANDDAFSELLNNGRAGVKKGILFLSDGGANQPDSVAHPCEYANTQATIAKNNGIEVYTIGFGVHEPNPNRILNCEKDEAGPYGIALYPPDGASVTRLLADMATQPSADNCAVGTTDQENTDGDYFFCLPKDEDLSEVFLSIATQFAKGSRLVQLPEGS